MALPSATASLHSKVGGGLLSNTRFKRQASSTKHQESITNYLSWCLVLGAWLLPIGIGLMFAANGAYIDEADNVAVAQLIVLDGSVLYRDLFSHHFPFTYYWAAAFFKLFGVSIFNARLAVLGFNALAFGSVGLVWRNMRIAGFAWLIWTCVSPFFLGHLMLYQALAATALAPVFAAGLAYISRRPLPRLWVMALVGLFAAITVLSNPLTLFAVALTFGVIALPAILGLMPTTRLEKGLKGLKRLGLLRQNLEISTFRSRQFESALCISVILAPFVGAIVGFVIFLGMNDALGGFYRDVIIFNRDVYAHYSDTVRTGLLDNIGKITINLVSGLTLLDPSQQMYPIDALKDWGVLANWLISDIAFKFIIISFCVWLIYTRKIRAALFTYAFAACALIRGRTNFDHLPLLMCSVLVLAYWAGERTKHQAARATSQESRIKNRPDSWLMRLPSFFSFLGSWLVALGSWLLVLGSLLIGLSQHNNPATQLALAQDETTAQKLQQWTCNQPNVKLGFYPANPYVHFYSQLRPVSRYLFVWPWVAEVGATDIANTLEREPYIIVQMVTRGDIWGVPNAVSLVQIANTVQRNFVQIDDELYLSRPLYDACVSKIKNEKFRMKN